MLGIALLWKFTTVCAVSLPGPAPIPRFAARPATSGASQRLTTRLCQQKSAPILPSRPLAPCLVLCSAESGIGLLLAARPPRCGCSPSNSKDANKSALLNSPTAPASNPPNASAICDFRQTRQRPSTGNSVFYACLIRWGVTFPQDLICARQNTKAYSNSASLRPPGRGGT